MDVDVDGHHAGILWVRGSFEEQIVVYIWNMSMSWLIVHRLWHGHHTLCTFSHTDRCFRWSSSLRWSNQSIFPLVALKLLEKDFCCWLEMWSATRLKNILQAISGPRGEQFPIGCFSKSIIPYGIRAMWKPCSSRSWRCRISSSPLKVVVYRNFLNWCGKKYCWEVLEKS